MQPLGKKVYLLKRYSPSDSFCTFFFWECLYASSLQSQNVQNSGWACWLYVKLIKREMIWTMWATCSKQTQLW